MRLFNIAGLGLLGLIFISCNLRTIKGEPTFRPAYNGFGGQEGSTNVKLDNNSAVHKVSIRQCYQCVGSKVKSTLLTGVVQRCDRLRHWLKVHDDANKKKRFFDLNEHKHVIDHTPHKNDSEFDSFKVQCTKGVEDCFNLAPVDHRLLGYEQRGCGSGPKEVAAEPGEKCVEDYQKIEQNDTLMRNCVCEDNSLCNGGSRLHLSGWLMSVAVVLSLVVLHRFP